MDADRIGCSQYHGITESSSKPCHSLYTGCIANGMVVIEWPVSHDSQFTTGRDHDWFIVILSLELPGGHLRDDTCAP